MRRLGWFIVLGTLVACGGGGSAPMAPSGVTTQAVTAPAPAPRPPAPQPPAAPPPSPVLPASFGVVGSPTFPQCSSLTLGAMLGLLVANCPTVAWAAQNTGSGCASGVHGTVTLKDSNGNEIGAVEWAYSGFVRPREQFVFSAGPVAVPTRGGNAYATFAWTNVACQ